MLHGVSFVIPMFTGGNIIDYRYIEAFLAVVNTNSLSKAAESLYVSQSSISKWICQLEEEIGVELIVRHKGQRSIELTASGKELVPLAEEWMNLHGQIIGMKEHNRTSIRIVSDPADLSGASAYGSGAGAFGSHRAVSRYLFDGGTQAVRCRHRDRGTSFSQPDRNAAADGTVRAAALLGKGGGHIRAGHSGLARISIFRADILCGSGMSTGSTLPKAIFGSIRRLRQECSSARKDFGRSYR